MMDELHEDLKFEIEALQATYDEHNVLVNFKQPNVCIGVKLLPQGAGAEQHFVELLLEITVPQAYPEELPCVQLLEAKGLGDDRQHALLQTLHAETHGMAGHPVLGLLAETARAFLTDNNHPEGDCAFCLLPMEAAAAAQGAVAASSHDDAPVCMPCFHAFHVGCYLQWWAWRQRDLAAEEAQLRAHTGAAATAAIASEKLPPKEDGHEALYTVSCPVCRAPTPLASMPHLAPQLLQAHEDAAHSMRGSSSVAAAAAQVQGGFGPAATGPLASQWAQQQARLRQVFEKQRAAGGIISTDTSYSISRLQLHAAAASDEGTGAPGAAPDGACEARSRGRAGSSGSSGRGVGQAVAAEGAARKAGGRGPYEHQSHGHSNCSHRRGRGSGGRGGGSWTSQQPSDNTTITGTQHGEHWMAPSQPLVQQQQPHRQRGKGQGQQAGGKLQQPSSSRMPQPHDAVATSEASQSHKQQQHRPGSAQVVAGPLQDSSQAEGATASLRMTQRAAPPSVPSTGVAPAPSTSSTDKSHRPAGSARSRDRHHTGKAEGGQEASKTIVVAASGQGDSGIGPAVMGHSSAMVRASSGGGATGV